MAALEIRAASHIGMNGTNPLCVSGVITTLSAARYMRHLFTETLKNASSSSIIDHNHVIETVRQKNTFPYLTSNFA